MNVRRAIMAAVLVIAASALSRPAEGAQVSQLASPQPARQAARPAQLTAPAEPAMPRAAAEDADVVRDQLHKLLSRYSPNVGRILALDPLLLQNGPYLEPYPDLVAFLNQHPEISRNSAYYLAPFRPDYYREPDRESRALDLWGGFFAGLGALTAFLTVTGVLVWVIKLLVDYRRWVRLSKIQTDAHNKLLDRLAANEELLAYIGSSSGRRFLESAPIMLDASTSVPSPLKRILGAVQIGVVLIVLGVGFFFMKNGGAPAEASQMMFAAAVLAIALGLGFVLAAVASFVISKRMGVLLPSSPGTGRTDAPPAA